MKITTLTKTLREVGILTLALTAALVINYTYGAWTDPTAPPTGGNIAAPLNVSNTQQVKQGILDLNKLKLTHNSPYVYLQDTSPGEMDARFIASNDRILFQLDEADNPTAPSWNNALILKNNQDNGNPDFAQFAGDIRADRYCDRAGGNCSSAPFGGGTTGSTIIPGWPDAIYCLHSNNRGVVMTNNNSAPHPYGDFFYESFGSTNVYNPDGSWKSGSPTDCSGMSIADLSAAGKAFSFNSTVFEPINNRISFVFRSDIVNEFLSISLTKGVDWCSLGMCPDAIHSNVLGRENFCRMVLPGSTPILYTNWAFSSPDNNDVVTWDDGAGGWIYAAANGYNSVINTITCEK